MCLLVSSYDIFTEVFILIPSVILGNSRPYPMVILKQEHTLKSLRCLCAIIAVVYDLLHNYILTNNNYDVAVN